MRPFPGRAAAVPHTGSGRTTGGLDTTPGHRDPPHRLGQQPRVGRVGHIRRDHRGVRPQPGRAQQLGLCGLGQQRLVAPIHRSDAAAGRELHQRRRVRDVAVDGDPAEPPPGDRVADLTAQALVSQVVTELQKHHPQVGFHRRRRPAHSRVEERHERHEEHRVIQQRVDPSELLRQPQHLRRQHRLPQTHVPSSRPQHPLPPEGSSRQRDNDLVTRDPKNGDTPSENPRPIRETAVTFSGRSS